MNDAIANALVRVIEGGSEIIAASAVFLGFAGVISFMMICGPDGSERRFQIYRAKSNRPVVQPPTKPTRPFPSVIPITAELIDASLPPDLSAVVLDYLDQFADSPMKWGKLGLWEACANRRSVGISDLHHMFIGACAGGHMAIIELMIARGIDDCWDGGLLEGCVNGHLEVVDLMIACGAVNWDSGLGCAHRLGHRAIIDRIDRAWREYNAHASASLRDRLDEIRY